MFAVRIVVLADEPFVAALPNVPMVILGIGMLLGISKAASGLRDKMLK